MTRYLILGLLGALGGAIGGFVGVVVLAPFCRICDWMERRL